jgi:hypothetical protein
MCLATGCALDFESVEVGFVCCVERFEVGYAVRCKFWRELDEYLIEEDVRRVKKRQIRARGDGHVRNC